MRSELISAELYATPSVISPDSKRVYVSCGSHILTHSLKTGKLLDSSESVLAKPTNLVMGQKQLIVSQEAGSKLIELVNCKIGSSSELGSYRILASSGSISVVVTAKSSEVVLGFVDGPLNTKSKIVTIYTGPAVSGVSCSAGLIAAVTGANRRTLMVYDIKAGSTREYLHNKPLTCSAIHPLNAQVAAGDISGMILRWALGEQGFAGSYTTMNHWHSVPVASLVYTSNGSVLLSGAEEGVLCIWNESTSDSKPQFIPRLGGPIVHLSVSRCNQYVAVSLKTNVVVVVDLFTRSIQSMITGTLHDGDESLTNVSGVKTQDGSPVIAITTVSHVQLFDMDSRRSVNKSLISVQERNHIPSTLRAKVKAAPWECKHVSVLTSEKSTWYMMAALGRSRVRSRRSNPQLIKVFASTDCGISWSLHTVCLGAHADAVVGVEAVGTGFVTASKDGSLKLWRLTEEGGSKNGFWSVVRTVGFRSQTPSFLNVSRQGLIIAGFGRHVTLWNPSNLTELSNGRLISKANVVSAGLVEDSTDLLSVCEDGEVILWDLKKLKAVASKNIGQISKEVCAAVIGDRMLVASQGELVSVSVSSKRKLIADRIVIPDEQQFDSIVVGDSKSAIVSSRKGRMIHRLRFDNDTATDIPFREADETIPEDADAMDETEGPQDPRSGDRASREEKRRVFVPISSVVSRLFPLENALNTVGSPEEQFVNLMIYGGLVPTIAF